MAPIDSLYGRASIARNTGHCRSLFLRGDPRRPVTSAVAMASLLGLAMLLNACGREPAANNPDQKVGSGVTFTNDRVASVPWNISLIQVDRSRKDLAFFAAHAKGKVLGVSLLADQAREIPPEVGTAIAGVNGDFYERDNRTYAGDPRGLQIMNGELISGPSTVAVWFDVSGNPHLDEVKSDFKVKWSDGRAVEYKLNQQRRTNMVVLFTPGYGPSTRTRGGLDILLEHAGSGPWLPLAASRTIKGRVRAVQPGSDVPLVAGELVISVSPEAQKVFPEVVLGDELEISTATTPDLTGVKTAIGGGPALIKDGKAFSLKSPPPGTPPVYSERSKYDRHPRSAIGWSPTHVYLVTVDGRQPNLSVGIKLAELAEYLANLGCTDAMNFDGGKSAQMWMEGKIKNSPCEGEDTVANSLMVIRKADAR